eukprot:3169511-Rhodomonas_salina.1
MLPEFQASRGRSSSETTHSNDCAFSRADGSCQELLSFREERGRKKRLREHVWASGDLCEG